MVYNNISEAIGNTPIIKLAHEDKDSADIYVKLESRNPGGSVKDRPVKYILKSLLDSGELKEGGTIVESTSGNTGVALSMLGAAFGLHVIIVMPETMSVERRNLIQAYGAELVLTPGSEGMKGAGEKAAEIAKEKNAPIFGQFVRHENVQAHEETTAKEILADLDQVDGFVAGIGTGGTVTGVGKTLKAHDKNTVVWGVEPEGSPLLNEGKAGSHKIQGIGANFIPKILDQNVLDKVDIISNEDAIQGAVHLAHEYGILAGFSSGGNYVSAKRLAKELGPGKHVVTVLPDTGERYLSTGAFSNDGE
ncbi:MULTISPECIES: cysteine synthase A [Aerococcus]|uniref:cysteine synthase n=2 Tax=Lactobacillales TaxID=186826 RepID=A0A0X8FEW4_9LACT|nr:MULTISPECIES: cysteine synthase A [Aerococcus]AMB96044.1 cysteine synthase [Aerococcus urinae]KAA9298690.1 cysteine synthase A [Aerococcus tenax]MCY3033131.1 cysteine synthase A [Aerococcus urinae]MCY3038275.1 cysteine synthase A [Aerococcus urinae]MCY3045177.1 cysteine synthase A [Aerococcus urinae]